jgi:tetratricopeptide (TPR) repeat protein
MDSKSDPKPIPRKPRNATPSEKPKKSKRKAKQEEKYLTLIGARHRSREAELAAKPARPRAEPSEGTQSFRGMAQRGSGTVAQELTPPRISSRAKRRELFERRMRIIALGPKFAWRRVRRFHRRFSTFQIILFYIGLPVIVSVIVCLSLLVFRPKVETVQRGVPSGGPGPGAAAMVSDVVAALGEGDRGRANELAAKLVEAYPNDARSYVAQGAVLAERKEYDKARISFQKALEISPSLAAVKMNLGELEFAVGNYVEATKFYEAIAPILRTHEVIPFRLYLCYSLTGRDPEAQVLVEKGTFRPQSAEWFFVQASEAIRQGRPSDAKGFIMTAKTLFGKKAEAYETSFKKIGWLN